jgi:hypothetical protein
VSGDRLSFPVLSPFQAPFFVPIVIGSLADVGRLPTSFIVS